ncbi:hypothetical protein E2C01_079708 [Portunus trituberculatus]|uniref:Uncharacterized protein n=1 Tax=Portunus trituberculatus TaxID=210409 RepID=A0A5B7IRA6_PORTR|nr:hypothetical protein [Portunus trituberculatus]
MSKTRVVACLVVVVVVTWYTLSFQHLHLGAHLQPPFAAAATTTTTTKHMSSYEVLEAHLQTSTHRPTWISTPDAKKSYPTQDSTPKSQVS